MSARTRVASLAVFLASLSSTRAAEAIDAPSAALLQFMGSAHEVYVFPNRTPRNPHRDDKHMRLLAPEARQQLLRLISHKRNWYVGGDSRIGVGPPPKDIGLLLRRGRDELVLFFSPGELIDARFNGQRQPTRWSPDGKAGKAYEAMERWKSRYAQPELNAR